MKFSIICICVLTTFVSRFPSSYGTTSNPAEGSSNLEAVCDNLCYVAETCTLRENATCTIGECCENCQLKQRGLLCRDSMNECDLPEYCSGDNEKCPSNVYLQNGVSCSRNNVPASCFNGMCISYDDQCQYIWGDGAKMAHQKCWRYNTQGSNFGNCGLDENGIRVACSQSNKMCGKLLCEGGEVFPLLALSATASEGFVFDENGNKRFCKALNMGEDIPDPGYVADGSPCLENMFCYKYECINRTFAGITPCPEDCNRNGICNSENHCHCNDTWAPPTCDIPGHGGSIDSGPTMPIPPDYRRCYSSRSEYHRDCHDIFKSCHRDSGVYLIQPDDAPEPFKVYCNHSVDGGGWTVLQRRMDGSIDFYRIWNEYKKGFGFLGGEFWLGNDKISYLTNQKDYELRIDMNNVNGDPYFVKYNFFRVSDEWSKYNMTLGDYMPESTAERDSLSYHNNMGFTTHDNDNDLNSDLNCAVQHGGAWWYKRCDFSDFNANYFAAVGSDMSIEWTGLPGGSYNLKFVEMKVRPL